LKKADDHWINLIMWSVILNQARTNRGEECPNQGNIYRQASKLGRFNSYRKVCL